MPRLFINTVLFASLLCVCSCGWRLRGTLVLPDNVDTLYVTAKDAHGGLVTDLRRLLVANKVNLTDKASDAQFAVIIHQERYQRRAVSVGNNALAAEYELTMEIQYELQEKNNPDSTPLSTASVSRSFDFDENDVVGKDQEEGLIQGEMRRELVQQIMRKLQVFAKSQTSVRQRNPATLPY